jgi:hypothetical protein
MRKEGLWALYSLDQEDIPIYLGKLVEATALALGDDKVAQDDRERLKGASRTGTICPQLTTGAGSKALKT